ncbi:hypothetical protein [Actinomadura coerulea]|uniref:hypothetical protein n=1 Tax=Actinomadura coerulea TaxID=46159 RepID=UPI003440EC95
MTELVSTRIRTTAAMLGLPPGRRLDGLLRADPGPVDVHQEALPALIQDIFSE